MISDRDPYLHTNKLVVSRYYDADTDTVVTPLTSVTAFMTVEERWLDTRNGWMYGGHAVHNNHRVIASVQEVLS